MLFPTELEDETLYSLISRLTIINGISPGDLNISTSKSYYLRAADIELDFPLLANFTHEHYGKINELTRRYVPKSTSDQLGQHTLIGLSNRNKNIWRWCWQCAAEEERKMGIAYWHKFHQHTCVLTCLKHQSPLLEVNIPFRERQSKFLLPKDTTLLKCHPACSNEHMDTAIAVAQIKDMLIQDNLEFNQSVIEDMFLKIQLSKQCVGLVEHTIKTLGDGTSASESYIRGQLTSNVINWAYLPARIYMAYGSYEMFRSQYQWHFTMNRGIWLVEDKAYVDIQTRHRTACCNFTTGNPNSTRTEFWKANMQAARWLSRYDSEWYKTNLPSGKLNAVEHLPKQLSLLGKRN